MIFRRKMKVNKWRYNKTKRFLFETTICIKFAKKASVLSVRNLRATGRTEHFSFALPLSYVEAII